MAFFLGETETIYIFCNFEKYETNNVYPALVKNMAYFHKHKIYSKISLTKIFSNFFISWSTFSCIPTQF